MTDTNLSSFLWSVADLLRGDYKQSEYGKVILPFTVLRRLDCVLESSKAAVLEEKALREKAGHNPEPFLMKKSGVNFYNTSRLDMKKLMGDQDHIAENLQSYIESFTPAVRDVFTSFDFFVQIDRLKRSNLLYLVTEKFVNIDLHPDKVTNTQMGLVFEDLIRKFAELSNETAGEHFTPREVIRLMVNLLFVEDDDALSKPGVVRSLYDPTAGTGGMLSVADEHLADHNPHARLAMFGQELNPESYAICKADMLIKGQDIGNIVFGNTLSGDGHPGKKFDYMLSNPPFGVEWKKIEKEVRKENETLGHRGRFGPGLPRVSDGSLLFLMHLLSKMQAKEDGGSRFGIVLNGSPLFTGGAGSGESEIRRYVLENDLVEAIIGLPTDMFYNTGISTYIWIVSNRKPKERKGQVQLIDASSFWQKMRKSLGSKRKELSPNHIDEITRIFGEFEEVTRDGVPISRIFKNEEFGYRTITVERPLRLRVRFTPDYRNALAELCKEAKDEDFALAVDKWAQGLAKAPLHDYDRFREHMMDGIKVRLTAKREKLFRSACTEKSPKVEPVTKLDRPKEFEVDPDLRDTENVPLKEDVAAYFKREVLPHAPDAWIDPSQTKIGYEIPFNRHFYVFKPPRPLAEIDADLKVVTDRILTMIQGLTK